MIGTKLGPYEITAKLGEGGMGEVYRANDSKLKRDVAIKVLPAAFVEDRERLARFEREAQLLAQLQHANIASIYGLEEAHGSRALVMELVEGPTLAEKLEQGPLAVGEALAIARQIAEALEDAHQKGIVHRDLKPQNVKLSIAGVVKVLDFGLAKAMEPAGTASGSASASQLAASPTLTLGATAQGMILGTAAYMAPEQARGGAVDKRADIWSFGVVLYEMLTGESLFGAGTVSDTLAGVLKNEIDLGRLPDPTPAALRRLLRRCLERNLKSRLHDIADARIEIDEISSGGEALASDPIPAPRPSVWLRLAPWAAVAAVGALWAVDVARRDAAVPAPAATTVLPLDLGDDPISLTYGAGAILSPDGRRMAWVAGRKNETTIRVRDLGSAETRQLAGTEGAQDPAFSPDGSELAFFAGSSLLEVPVGGGIPVRLAEVGLPRGLTWTDDGAIIYNRDVAEGLWRVPGGGGAPERLTAPDEDRQERSHRWPHAVPGTRKVLFLTQLLGQIYEESTIEMLDLDSGQRSAVHRGGSYPRTDRDGTLLYVRDRALWAAPLDLAAGRLGRQPVRVLDEIAYSEWSGGAQFDAASGTLVYSTGRSDEAVQISWFDPTNRRWEAVVEEPGFYYDPALSPNGKTVVLQLYSVGRDDLWLFDLDGGTRRRLTFGGRDEHPVWSADGNWVAFSRTEGASQLILRARADGAGEPIPVAESAPRRFPTSWSPQGALLMTELSPQTQTDLWVVWPDQPDRVPEPFLATPNNEQRASFSPSGRWVVYDSDESGADEIYVRAFPGPGGRSQISNSGGLKARWATDGSAIYFWSRDGLVRRRVVEQGGTLVPGPSERLEVDKPILQAVDTSYVVGDDGRVLLFPFAVERGEEPRTLIVLDWRSVLQRRLGESR